MPPISEFVRFQKRLVISNNRKQFVESAVKLTDDLKLKAYLESILTMDEIPFTWFINLAMDFGSLHCISAILKLV
jgi:hypothetical protein